MADCAEPNKLWRPSTRREIILTLGADPDDQIGIEIGAANNPIIPNSVGQCKYVDYMTKPELLERLKDYPYRDSLVEVDYIWSGSGSLSDKVDGNVFDYAIASHVIEHVPNPLGWFQGIADVLSPGASFNLAIPDRRYTFDFACPESTVGQLVEAYLLKYEIPSPRQVFDSCFYGKAIEPGERWIRAFDANDIPAYVGDIAPALALAQAKDALTGKYFDSHCWVFTPASFLKLMEGVCQLGLMPFEFFDYHPTVTGEFEFFLCLKKPEDGIDKQELLERQMQRLAFFGKVLEESRRTLRLLAE